MQTAKLKTWITRLAFVFVGLLGWYLTQAWIGQRELSPGAIGDGVHDWLAGANAYLHQHPERTDQLLIASSAVIDLLGFFYYGDLFLVQACGLSLVCYCCLVCGRFVSYCVHWSLPPECCGVIPGFRVCW